MSGAQQPAVNDKLQTYKVSTVLSHSTATVWFRRIKAAARALRCEDALLGSNASEQSKAQANWLVTTNLPDSYTYLLDAHTNVRSLWTALESEFAGTSFLRKADLYGQLHLLRPNNESMDSFLNRALDLRTAFKSAEIDDENVLSAFFLITLRSIEPYKDWAIQKLQSENPDDLPTLVTSLRTTFRSSLQEACTPVEPLANAVQSTSGKGSCGYCNKPGHNMLACWKLRKDQEAYDAKNPPKKKKGPRNAPHAHQAQCFVTMALNASCSPNVFYLDSCCTHHMVNDKSFLSDFTPSSSICCFADKDKTAQVCGKGTMTLKNHAGRSITLENVLYVPTFQSNLISVTQADSRGLLHRGGNGKMDIVDSKGTVHLTAQLDNGLYRVKCTVNTNQPMAAKASTSVDAELVHRRYGHMGYSTLHKMAESGVVNNLPPAVELKAKLSDHSVCGPCAEGRQKAESFPRSPADTAPYEKLHIDIGQWNGITSHGGNKVFGLLVDDSTGFKWICTVPTKPDVALWLQEKIVYFKRQGHKLSSIRFDRDTVFMSKTMQKFLKDHHITSEPTSGYSPQENGHAERGIGVVKEITQSLLSDSGLKHTFWGDAMWHAVHLLNLSNSQGRTTPWERIKGEKPDASTLRIWGCKCWVVVPKTKRKQRTERSEECRYMGVAWPNSKSFKLMRANGTVHISRHVLFDESAPPACAKKHVFDEHMELAPLPPPSTAPHQPSTSQPSQDSTGVEADITASGDSDAVPAAQSQQQSISHTLIPVSNNPIFEECPDPDHDVVTETRTSARSNKGVPATKPYDQHLHGMPGARLVSSFW